MTASVEGKVASDVVKFEQNSRYSRETRTITHAQTVTVGMILKEIAAGDEWEIHSADVNEVQLLAITGAPSDGNFVIHGVDYLGNHVYTDPIAHDADIAGINTGLATAFGADQIVASGTAITATVLTFSGTNYAKKSWPLLEIDIHTLVSAEDCTISRTTRGGVGPEICIALADVTTDADPDTADIPVLVRDAIVSRDNLELGTATAAVVEAELAAVGILTRDD